MRIAIGGIATESCTFSPLPTRYEDFRIQRGEDLLASYAFLLRYEAEYLPTVRARALPGGSVEMSAYEKIKSEFLELLHPLLPLDGLYLDMHGAMNVRGMDDAETDWIAAAREVVGADCLISASFDLHANISEREVELLDMLTTFRTAPHVDVVETQEKALAMLVHSLREKIRPYKVWIPIPVVLPGEKTSTEWEPGLSLYESLKEIDPVPGVMDASIFVGYVWADEPRAHATITFVGTNRAVIEREAAKLAQKYWDIRDDFRFGVQDGSIDECIRWALDAPERPVIISDSGDNPTAGGVGDLPLFLERLLALNVPDAVVASIADSEATETCYKSGVGVEVQVTLGGKLDTIHAKPLPVIGRVKFLLQTDDILDRQAVLEIGGVQVIVTQRRRPYHYIADFQRLGIEPNDHKIVVVKVGYLVPELKAAAARAFIALSPGAVDQAIERLPFQRIQRPMYPLDKDLVWKPSMTDNCLFCGIVKDDVEASLVYEDELTLAFMNLRQGNPGHVIVIPKAHIETVDELDPELASALFRTVVKVAQGIKVALKPDGMNIWQSNGIAAGQEIPHLHIHLFPRMLNDNRVRFYTQLPPLAERSYLNELAEQIRVALATSL